MFSVEIHNFQSIESLTIEVDRFTALVGRSNIGKSAIIRAMKAALENALGTAFVRHSPTCARRLKSLKNCKCQCSVHIKGEGFDLLWEKGDAINKYTYNGKEYDSVDRGVPSFLQEAGFAPLKIGDRSGPIQVADQFYPIFLLDQSGSVAAEIISDVARLDAINDAMKLVEKDKKEATSNRKFLEREVERLDERLVEFFCLDEALSKAARIQDELQKVESQRVTVQRFERYLTTANGLSVEIKSLHKVATVSITEALPFDQTLSVVDRLTQYQEQVSQKDLVLKTLSGVDSIEIDPFDALLAKELFYRALDNCFAKVKEAKLVRDSFAHLASAQDLTIPEVLPLSDKRGMAQQLTQLEAKLSTLEKVVEKLETTFFEAGQELDQAQSEMDTLGVCPTCTQYIQSDSGHQHREGTHA